MGQSIEGRSDISARAVVAHPEFSQVREIAQALAKAGCRYEHFTDIGGAFASIEKSGAEILIVDLARLSIDPTVVIEKLRALSPHAELILTAPTPLATRAITAIRAGAFGYVTTPVNAEELNVTVERALTQIAQGRESLRSSEQLDFANMASVFVLESVASRDLVTMVKRAAASDAPVLIQGETGCDKEMIARRLHRWSARRDGPFVRVSLKFIAAQGGTSFAARDLITQHFERAAGGTIYLDDLADASADVQLALTTLLEEAASRRRDFSEARVRAARIVASITSDRVHDVAAGVRSDLYLGLNVISVRIAPLRERAQDILAIVKRMLAMHALMFGRVLRLSADADQALLAYQWPGNERELANVMERAFAMSPGDTIDAAALGIASSRPFAEPPAIATEAPGIVESPDKSGEAPREAQSDSDAATSGGSDEPHPTVSDFGAPQGTLQEWLDRAATVRINAALAEADGNRARAAESLSIDRTTLTRLMRRLGI